MGQSLRDTRLYARLVEASLDVGQGAYDKPVVAGLLVASYQTVEAEPRRLCP
jgi:hypothetical protein